MLSRSVLRTKPRTLNHRALFHSNLLLLGRRPLITHALAGLVGGLTVITGAYAYFHISGAKRSLDKLYQVKKDLEMTHRSIQDASKLPSQALQHLRQAAKLYVSFIPFAGIAVDKTFDKVLEVVDEHGDQVKESIERAYEDIRDAVAQEAGEDRHIKTAIKIGAVCKRLSKELSETAIVVGKPLVSQVNLQPVVEKTTTVSNAAKDLAAKTYTSARDHVSLFLYRRKDDPTSVEETVPKSDGGSTNQ